MAASKKMNDSEKQLADKATANNSTNNNVADFEAQLAELETLVTDMEQGELSLNDSLKAFERGVKLTNACLSALQQAELTIEKLESLSQEAKTVDYKTDE